MSNMKLLLLIVTFAICPYSVLGRLAEEGVETAVEEGAKDFQKVRFVKNQLTDTKLFRIVRGGSPPRPVVLVPDPKTTDNDTNVGFDLHCSNYPGCPHPKWTWGKKRSLRSPYFDEKYQDFPSWCLTVDLSDITDFGDKGKPIEFNLHMYPCTGGNDQEWVYCSNSQTLKSCFWGCSCQSLSVAKEPQTSWCVTRKDINKEDRGEYIANGVVQECDSGAKNQLIELDFNTEGEPKCATEEGDCST